MEPVNASCKLGSTTPENSWHFRTIPVRITNRNNELQKTFPVFFSTTSLLSNSSRYGLKKKPQKTAYADNQKAVWSFPAQEGEV